MICSSLWGAGIGYLFHIFHLTSHWAITKLQATLIPQSMVVSHAYHSPQDSVGPWISDSWVLWTDFLSLWSMFLCNCEIVESLEIKETCHGMWYNFLLERWNRAREVKWLVESFVTVWRWEWTQLVWKQSVAFWVHKWMLLLTFTKGNSAFNFFILFYLTNRYVVQNIFLKVIRVKNDYTLFNQLIWIQI